MENWTKEECKYRQLFIKAIAKEMQALDMKETEKQHLIKKIRKTYEKIMKAEAEKREVELSEIKKEDWEDILKKYPSETQKGILMPTVLATGIIFQMKYKEGLESWQDSELEQKLLRAVKQTLLK